MPDLFVASNKTKKKTPFIRELLSTFYENPQQIRFQDQHDHEKILLFLRKHWVTNIPWITLSFILLLVPVFGIPFINISDLINLTIPFNYLIAGIMFWYLLTFGFILTSFLFWFYNVGIITNERIIDVDYIYLLYSEVTATVIEKIEDVTNKRGGFLEVIIDSGDVFVQTAGTEPNIEFQNIPKPNLVVKTLTNLLQRSK